MAYTDIVRALQSAHQVVYWPGTEASGTTAVDLSGNGRNGTYHDVALGQPSFEDDTTALGFNGTTSVLDAYSGSLVAAFTPGEFTMSLWFKIPASVWTDGRLGRLLTWQVNASNRVLLQKNAAANSFSTVYIAGGVNRTITKTPYNPVSWVHWALTVSKSANQMKVYLDGRQDGATLTSLGTWVGTTDPIATVLGALNYPGPVSVLTGSLAHFALWNVALSSDDIEVLASPVFLDPADSPYHYIAPARTLHFRAPARTLHYKGRP